MIKLTDFEGRKLIVNKNEISKIVEAGASGRWHGVNSYLHLKNGTVVELQDTIDQIEEKLSNAYNLEL